MQVSNTTPLSQLFKNLEYDDRKAKKYFKEVHEVKSDYLQTRNDFRVTVDNLIANKIQSWIDRGLPYNPYTSSFNPIYNPFNPFCYPDKNRKLKITTPYHTCVKWNFFQTLFLFPKLCDSTAYNSVESLKERLLKENPDLEARDSEGNTPLLIALSSLNNTPEDDLSKPLIKCRNLETVILLLELGADPNAKNNEGDTPLHLCTRSSLDEILVGHFLQIPGIDINAINHEGETPLFCSLLEGRVATSDLLMAKGADVTLGRNAKGYHMLHAAIKSANCVCMKQIIEARGELLEESNKNGQTPLDYAVRCSEWQCFETCEVLKVLLDAGANVNCRDWEGWTPLHKAYKGTRIDIVEILLGYGADINAKNKNGLIPYDYSERLLKQIEDEAQAKKKEEALPAFLRTKKVYHEEPRLEMVNKLPVFITEDSKSAFKIISGFTL